ncbi:sensor histidine kinase [Phytopseudomonas dryadis]|uniref:C4-dicarboxylate transport sensor protein DctB n=1 Tax=Phytopseudomonas dryadis TaxID=2487520 RepID=A0A4Q9R0I6_9GAMM|nr:MULTISPECIES: ATP-binding protein [Pseudomonas]TBU92069.1 two-component sensor histidine kinase [Pseudomonas dryadis]TBV04351.1 two-component sensor histidine kinase [Pseudomonas dryadis]TBV17077.1 two-component sensor histidine kinase [Pseudomonas sp. FRB 230]
MSSLLSRYRIVAIVLLVVLGLAVSLWLGGRYAEQRAWAERSHEAHGQLQLYAQSIQTLVDRYRSVPQLLSMDGDIQSLLLAPEDPQLRDKLNRRLEQLNVAAGSSVLYLIDPQGVTLAASNWQEWSSFVGSNYGFRPYFQDALHRTAGRYFAVGVTTGVPGYFLSHAVYDDDGTVIGVLVVKLELEELQREWVGQPGVLLVADSYGVVILSSRPAWRFRALEELDELDHAELVEVRKYAERSLQTLPKQPGRHFDGDADWMHIDGPDGRQAYLWQRLELPSEAWTLHLLIEENSLGSTARSYRLAAGGVWLTLVFLVLFLLQRHKNQRLQASIRENLEREVTLRTAELREAQEGLVHAAKMAALGQMSAAMAHEINQPLTAIQMHLGSLGLLLDSGREDAVREGMQRIDGLLQRMAGLTGHLKTFARKSPGGLCERLLLSDVLEQALQLLAPRLRSEQVELRREIRGEARVSGDAIRLEQVLLNLLNNALDAMLDSPTRVLGVLIEVQGDSCLLRVSDSGGGIPEEHLAHVFEPFFTTKPVGEGLGLGLAISYGIVRDLGGSLEAANGANGAVFTLRLPRL